MRKLVWLLLLLVACSTQKDSEEPAEVRIAYRSTVATLDPIAENTVISDSIYSNIYEPLVVRDDDLRLIPALAVDWSNPNDLTWDFKLRPNVKFHNGQPLTAEDVRFSIERARNDPSSQIASSLTSLDRVEVKDKNTIRIITRKTYSILLSRLADIWIIQKDFHPGSVLDLPSGTGPYKVKSWKPSKFLELESNTNYWDGTPVVPRIVFESIPDLRNRLGGLLKGDIQILPLLEPSALATVPGSNLKSISVQTSSSLATLFLGMDLWRSQTPYCDAPNNPFQDVRVRQALYHAINIDHIVRDILLNYATPATQLVAPKVFGFNEKLRRPGYDPGKARALLKEAGFPNGFTVRFDFTNNRYRNDAEIGKAIAKDLEAVGIHVTLNPRPMQDFVKILETRDTSLFMFGFTLPSTDASGAFDFLIHSRDPEHGYGSHNIGGFSNKDLDQLIEHSSEIMKPADRLAVLMDTMGKVMQDLPLIPLHVENSVSAHSITVQWTSRPDEFIYCKRIRFTD